MHSKLITILIHFTTNWGKGLGTVEMLGLDERGGGVVRGEVTIIINWLFITTCICLNKLGI